MNQFAIKGRGNHGRGKKKEKQGREKNTKRERPNGGEALKGRNPW